MTDPTSIVRNLVRLDGSPVTRADLVEQINLGVPDIVAGVTTAAETWTEQGDPIKLLAFVTALTQQLAGHSIPLIAILAEHDAEQDALDEQVLAAGLVIPDSIEVTE